ncbi:MAG: DUF11 domain-containing protein [Chloroflexi bacterium]|nr:DUF11 domain-containing protein [Chloroflexota bacterium]
MTTSLQNDRRFTPGQRGVGLVMALVLLAVAVPLITGALALASNLSIDSGVKERILKRQYSLMGATQYSVYRLAFESGYLDSLAEGVPDSYSIVLNGETITLTAVKIVSPSGTPQFPKSDNSRRLRVFKEVAPATTAAATLTTFNYSILIRNEDDEAEQITKVHDGLAPGFTYLAGSTTGVTTSNPSITLLTNGEGEDYQKLVWNLAPLHLTLQPGESLTLNFSAQATLGEGNYCNESWAEPGDLLTSTGPTAKVTVGSPAQTLCPGEAAKVTKDVSPAVVAGGALNTYTYTVHVANTGAEVLHMSLIRDMLPAGFTYVAGSTTGDITTADPQTTLQQGRQRLDWTLSPTVAAQPGAQLTLTFQTQAALGPGEYWNEAWITFDEFSYTLYTWPSAVVTAMGVVSTTAAAGTMTSNAEIWVGSGMYGLAGWYITR